MKFDIITILLLILIGFSTSHIYYCIDSFIRRKRNLKKAKAYADSIKKYEVTILPDECLEYNGHKVTYEEFEETFKPGDILMLSVSDETSWKTFSKVVNALIDKKLNLGLSIRKEK